MAELIVSSDRVLLAEEERPAALLLKHGRIAQILDRDAELPDLPHHRYEGRVILPGLVDTHVHINEPGRTHWEGFETATAAAAAGGITTLVDMPLNCIPSTVDLVALKGKEEASKGKLRVDVGFWGGAVQDNLEQLESLHQAGVLGFKCFLSHPGTEEFSNLSRHQLKAAMRELARLDTVLLVHAEAPDRLLPFEGDPRSYQNYLNTRPPEAELEAIGWVIEAAAETGCRAHVVHLATHEGIELFANTQVSVETCPHYLFFCSEEIDDGDTTKKCAPPIRDRANREALWQGLKQGHIDLVATDHSPSPGELKSDNFQTSWGGIAGLQLLLPSLWTAANERGCSLGQVSRWTSWAPAQLAGLNESKGSLQVGYDADLVVFDPEASFTVEQLYHRHPESAYLGRTLKGVVEATYLRGKKVFAAGAMMGPPSGRLLRRTEHATN